MRGQALLELRDDGLAVHIVRADKAHQAVGGTGVLHDDGGRQLDAGRLHEHRLHLAQLYAEAPQLHLVVEAAQKLNVSMQEPPCQVTCKPESLTLLMHFAFMHVGKI